MKYSIQFCSAFGKGEHGVSNINKQFNEPNTFIFSTWNFSNLSQKRFQTFRKYGWFVTLFAIVIPAINGCLVAYLSQFITHNIANRFVFAILAASASYIAVPAAMRLAAPKADPGLYLPMALGVTFPFNITIGMPLYFLIIQS